MGATSFVLALATAASAARSDDDGGGGTRIGAIECISHGGVLQMGVRARGKQPVPCQFLVSAFNYCTEI